MRNVGIIIVVFFMYGCISENIVPQGKWTGEGRSCVFPASPIEPSSCDSILFTTSDLQKIKTYPLVKAYFSEDSIHITGLDMNIDGKWALFSATGKFRINESYQKKDAFVSGERLSMKGDSMNIFFYRNRGKLDEEQFELVLHKDQKPTSSK